MQARKDAKCGTTGQGVAKSYMRILYSPAYMSHNLNFTDYLSAYWVEVSEMSDE
jgi:hypothetical protein